MMTLWLHVLASDHVSGDDETLDLTRALVDLVDLGVSEKFLHRVLGVKSSA